MFGAKRNVYFFATFFIPRAFSFFFSVQRLFLEARTLRFLLQPQAPTALSTLFQEMKRWFLALTQNQIKY